MSRLLVLLLLALVCTSAFAVRVSMRAGVRSDSDSDSDVDVDVESTTETEVETEAPHDAIDGFLDDAHRQLGSGGFRVGDGAPATELTGFSFDSQLTLTVPNMQCIFSKIGGKGYIGRAWRSNCQFDPNINANIRTAWAAGAQFVDVYMFPKMNCAKSAAQQVSDMLTGLGSSKFNRVWLDVESGGGWSDSNKQSNLDWIIAALNALEAKVGSARIGIYSSAVMWDNVLGSTVGKSAAARALAKYPMWYAQYDNNASYNRYTAFANWQKPYMKQYQGDVKVCGFQIDVNWRPNEPAPVNPTGPAPAQTCSSAGKPGLCTDISKTPCASGQTVHNLCSGAATVLCCLNAAPKLGDAPRPRVGAGVPGAPDATATDATATPAADGATDEVVYISQPFDTASDSELTAAADSSAPVLPPPVGAAAPSSIFGKLKGKIPDAVLAVLPDVATRYNLNTPLRVAHFLSQAATESGNFRITAENLNYSSRRLLQVFPRYFNARTAAAAGGKPQVIANTVYGNRMGNGNFASGDGYKYRGRGYIQLTGKSAYQAYSKFRGIDAVANPDLLAGPNALDSAAWFFGKFKPALLSAADKGSSSANVLAVTKLVNGGTNGLSERQAYFNKFWAALR